MSQPDPFDLLADRLITRLGPEKALELIEKRAPGQMGYDLNGDSTALIMHCYSLANDMRINDGIQVIEF